MCPAEVADEAHAGWDGDIDSEAKRIALIILVFNDVLIVGGGNIAPPTDCPLKLGKILGGALIKVVFHPLARNIGIASDIDEAVRIKNTKILTARIAVFSIVVAHNGHVEERGGNRTDVGNHRCAILASGNASRSDRDAAIGDEAQRMSPAEVADEGSTDANVDGRGDAERILLIVLVFDDVLVISGGDIAPPANRPSELGKILLGVVIEVVDHPLLGDIGVTS